MEKSGFMDIIYMPGHLFYISTGADPLGGALGVFCHGY